MLSLDTLTFYCSWDPFASCGSAAIVVLALWFYSHGVS